MFNIHSFTGSIIFHSNYCKIIPRGTLRVCVLRAKEGGAIEDAILTFANKLFPKIFVTISVHRRLMLMMCYGAFEMIYRVNPDHMSVIQRANFERETRRKCARYV